MHFRKHTILLSVVCVGAISTSARAQSAEDDPGVWRISTGVNYSEGDYGDTQKTQVISAPVALKYSRGSFSIRVSVPYVHIDGPGSLIDTPQGRDAGFGDGGFDDGGGSNSGTSGNSGSGSSGSGSSGSGSSGSGSSGSGSSGSGSSGSGSSGSGSSGSGSSGSGSGSSGSGSGSSGSGGGSSTNGGDLITAPGAPAANNRRSGIGDIAVTIGYSAGLGSSTWLDLSGRIKVPTASRAKRLGTGQVDFTLGADLVKDIGDLSIYAGGRRKFLGKPAGSTLRDIWGAGGGMSYRLQGGTVIGADYDWQQSTTAGRGASSEVTGWVNFGLSRRLRMQLFASTGFTTNSADFAGGLSLSFRLN